MNKIYLLLALPVFFLFSSCKDKAVQIAPPLEVSVTPVLQQDELATKKWTIS